MNILIISHHQDAHATVVAASAVTLGHSVLLWDAPSVSSDVALSVYLGDSNSIWRIGEAAYTTEEFDVIWFRRRHSVSVPKTVHPDDVEFAHVEVQKFYSDLWMIASQKTRWHHRPQALTAAEGKMWQLSIAKRLGFNIPPTLVSNDRTAILDFIAQGKARGEGTIYKTFAPISWVEQGRLKAAYTAQVTEDQILKNSFIESVPGIYQRCIDKGFEIRATFFGETELSVKIDSQILEYGEDDWRASIEVKGYLSPFSLPETIHKRCVQLMREMSVDIGCFDFIVDKKGNYYFLEVNQQGQFLWVEENCSEVPMLDEFMKFLLGERDFGRNRLSFSDVLNSNSHKKIAADFKNSRHVKI